MPRKIDEASVFAAVLQLWVREGYAGTTTKSVAELAGVNEATLFRRYEDKAQLVCRALTEQLARVPLVELTPSDDLRADLVRVVDAYQETYRQVGNVVPLLLVEVGSHPELRPVLDGLWTNLRPVTAIVAHHQSRGALRDEAPLGVVTALLAPLFMHGLMRRAVPERAIDVDVDEQVDAFLRGRATPSSSSE